MKIPMEQWRPVEFDRINKADARSPVSLLLALAQLAVTAHLRYRPTQTTTRADGKTWCNIFAWDSTRALDAEIPHWYAGSRLTGDGIKSQRIELMALGMIGWLRAEGERAGWILVSPEAARGAANQGRPAGVTWENKSVSAAGKRAPSHIAILLPSPDGGPQLIAQAGAECLFGESIARGFGNAKPLEFWAHP